MLVLTPKTLLSINILRNMVQDCGKRRRKDFVTGQDAPSLIWAQHGHRLAS